MITQSACSNTTPRHSTARPRLRPSRVDWRVGGFTLVEVVVVILIIGALAAIAVPRLLETSAVAADNALKQNLRMVRDSIELYAAEHGSYPGEAELVARLIVYGSFAVGFGDDKASGIGRIDSGGGRANASVEDNSVEDNGEVNEDDEADEADEGGQDDSGANHEVDGGGNSGESKESQQIKAELSPYLRKDFPICQIGPAQNTFIKITEELGPIQGEVNPTHAWHYNSLTGQFIANLRAKSKSDPDVYYDEF